MGSEGQPVRFRDCSCPGTPHDGRDGADDGDIVVLRSALGFAAGAEVVRKLGEANEDGEFMARATELIGPVYIREGPLSWNVVDANGPVPLTKERLDALSYADAYEIVEAADALYTEAIIAPLVKRMDVPSRNGRNGSSTRATQRSSRPRPSRRGSSSANGSAGQQSVTSP